MRTSIVIAVAAFLGLALVAFAAVVVPNANPVKGPARTLQSSRLFTLLPDGKVEISDLSGRRVYKWEGSRWVELEVRRLAQPLADMR
jgi:hypothetical protein